jgi:hypothetical protein
MENNKRQVCNLKRFKTCELPCSDMDLDTGECLINPIPSESKSIEKVL